MTGLWIRQPEHGSQQLLRFMIWLTRWFGRGTAYALLYPIALYFFVSASAARAASSGYLQRVLGRRPTYRERFRHVFTFAEIIMDRFLLAMGRLADFEVEVEGREMLDAILARGKGCVLLGAHIGSFDILRAMARRDAPRSLWVMMYREHSHRLHTMLAAVDPAADTSVIPLGAPQAVLRAKEALEAGEMVGILGDRIIAGDKVVAVDFLGSPATFPVGPMVLASALQAPVILFFGHHRGKRRYAVHFELFAERIELDRRSRDDGLAAQLQHYAAALERQCRLYPFDWFNFYDFWGDATDASAGAGRHPRGLSRRTSAVR